VTEDQHVIERDSDVPLRFTGAPIASASSYEPGKDRWTQLTLYLTSTGRYVLHEEGLTDVDGEDDRSDAYVADDAATLIAGLYKVNVRGKRYLTRLALSLIEDAAVSDDGVRAAYFVEV
jgi:hypothetical protein